jgi:hypothetical protein
MPSISFAGRKVCFKRKYEKSEASIAVSAACGKGESA